MNSYGFLKNELRKLRKLQNSYELTIFQSNVLWCNPQTPKTKKNTKTQRTLEYEADNPKKQ